MIEPFIEKNCIVTHSGKDYEAGGAMLTSDFCIGYLGVNNILTDWHGNAIGTYKIKSTWKINSFLSDTMNAVHVNVDGKLYKGRSLGIGMSFRGRRSIND